MNAALSITETPDIDVDSQEETSTESPWIVLVWNDPMETGSTCSSNRMNAS